MADQFQQKKKHLPVLGVGLGLRRELASKTLEHRSEIDWLEFVPENYMGIGGAARRRLHQAKEGMPLISHGVNLSLGSADPLNEDYLRALIELLDEVDSAWFSDHLCFTGVDGTYLHDLLPLPFNKETVDHIVKRIKYIQGKTERPFLIENISYYMSVPSSDLTEAQFLSEILEKADCGLLFDVNNVYVNSLNHGFDPFAFLDQIPLERTVQIHVAGHSARNDDDDDSVVIDTHGEAVVEPVFQMLEQVLKRTPVNAVMLERDQNFPEFKEILAELSTIRNIAKRAQPELLQVSANRPSVDGKVSSGNSRRAS